MVEKSVYRTPSEVISWMSASWRVIGLEGFCGAGKSWLAEALVREHGFRDIETDKYVRVKGGDSYYVDRLDLDALKNDIEEAESTQDVRCVIHGICLRDILHRIDKKADAYLYVKRV